MAKGKAIYMAISDLNFLTLNIFQITTEHNKKTAIKTFKVLDCKDWSRIDIRLDKNNVPNVLEVNALPGFMKDPKENSRLPKAAYAAGWSYEKLIGEVLNSAIRRLKTRKLKIFLSLVKL